MDARPTPRPGGRALAVRLVLPALILVLAVAVHLVTVAAGERSEREAARALARQAADDLHLRITQYGEVLYAVRGLFAASQGVDHAEFHTSSSARDTQRRFPGVRAIGFAELLTAADVRQRLPQLRASLAASGLDYPRLRLPRVPDGGRIAPITYLEPQTGNEQALGFDLLGEDNRRAALQRTLASDEPESTAPVRLADGTDRAFLVMLAARNPRRQRHGVAYAAFEMDELVDGVLPRADRRAELELYDTGPAGARARPLRAATVTYDRDADRDALAAPEPPFGRATVGFEVFGRRWALHYVPHRSLRAPNQALLNWLPLLIGGIFALLAFWVLSLSHRTERRATELAERMTESLRASQTDLARSNAELERFAYVASHDLREPLRTITGFLGLLSRRYRGRLDDDGREFVDLAVDGAKRMDALIAELLEYSRAGRREAGPEPTDLDAAWRVAVRNLSAAIADAGAEVTAGPLPVVLADRGEMVQVLQNLLGNAIKYRGEHAPAIRAEAVRRGDRWEVSVADDGPGIDPRHHERIFVLLQRLHRHDQIEGTGMGLAICKKIIESHGGEIWVESREGQGARFAFSLPAAPAPDREPALV